MHFYFTSSVLGYHVTFLCYSLFIKYYVLIMIIMDTNSSVVLINLLLFNTKSHHDCENQSIKFCTNWFHKPFFVISVYRKDIQWHFINMIYVFNILCYCKDIQWHFINIIHLLIFYIDWARCFYIFYEFLFWSC